MAELPQIYNSRLLTLYLEYLNVHYPDVDIDAIFQHAHITKYKLGDPGHWFNQQQVDQFYEKIIELTGNPNIARETGRYSISADAMGAVKQRVLGLLKIASIYLLLPKLYPLLSRGARVTTRKTSSNQIEVIVMPKTGVDEKPYQCENRTGIFESLAKLFANKYAYIEHPECIHRGDTHCRYLVSWEEPDYAKWRRCFILGLGAGVLAAAVAFFFIPIKEWLILLFGGGMMLLWLHARASHLESQDLARTIQLQGNVAEDHIKEINHRYQGAMLVQKIGQATSTILNVKQLATIVMQNIEHYLDFDRGIILLANPERNRLTYSASFGFDDNKTNLLQKIQFRLDNPGSKGLFVYVFRNQQPMLVDDISVIQDRFSTKSQSIIEMLGSKSLICLPIVYENLSLGIISVDKVVTKRSLTQSDKNLLMGVASQIAMSIFSAMAFSRLQDSEERYRSLYENAPTTYVSINCQNGAIVKCNAAAERLFGYSRESLIGSLLQDYLDDSESNHAFTQKMLSTLCNGQSVHNQTLILKHRQGHQTWVNVSLEPFMDAKGRVSEGRCIISDITEKKKLEEQLQHAQKMEAVGTLAGGVAHDLSNILSGIVSYPDLLLMDIAPDSPMRIPLQKIRNAGYRAAAVVQDLLTLARRGVTVTEAVNLNAIVDDYLKSPEFENLMRLHPNMRVEIDTDHNLLNIKGSAVHLTKAIMNIVINAAEAIPDNGVIQLITRNQQIKKHSNVISQERAMIIISDNGIGIGSEEIKRIFEPFYTKKTMGRSGTGLGMAIVWATVQDHNGHIDIQSVTGKGTTVTMTFPATYEPCKPKTVGPDVEMLKGAGQRILVVDDDTESREIASNMLRRLGYHVIAVNSGEKAVAYAQGQASDLIVLDMVLQSEMDGLATYRKILSIYPGQKAIITSGFIKNIRTKEAIRLGAGAYVKKPFSLREIGAAVSKVLAA